MNATKWRFPNHCALCPDCVCSNSVVQARSLRSKRAACPSEDTAVLIDGIRFRDAAAPQGDASGFLEDLDRHRRQPALKSCVARARLCTGQMLSVAW